MNILLIAPQPFFERRGTPLAVALLARALGELGHRIDLVTYHVGEDWPLPSVNHHRAVSIPFINSVRKGLSATKLFLDLFVFAKAWSLLRSGRYDCIHGVEEGAMMGVLLGKMFRLPLVYDMDSSIPEQIADSKAPVWTSRPLLAVADRLETWTIRNSNLVLAVCKALRDRVASKFPAASVAVLEDIPVVEKAPAGLDEGVRKIRADLGLEGAACVVYTGTFEAYQGISLLLESVAPVVTRYPQAVFLLVGGLPEQIPEVVRRAEALGIIRHLRILGRRPLEEMPAFMALADVLVSPRVLGSNTPMKIYAYLQSGRPLVATRLPTHTQVLDDTVALLAEATPQAFAEAIAELLEDSDRGTRLGAAGACLVEREFTYDAFKRKLEEAYTRISL